jgi:hypothetical protein
MRPPGKPSRHVVALAAAVIGACVPLSAARAQSDPPNIVFLAGDDWGWPYYGFIQRWISALIAGTCSAASANPGAPCTGHGQCPGGTCEADFVGDDADSRWLEYTDPYLLFPDSFASGRPPLDQLITPALDWLAASGNFWPWSHNSASISQPAFAVEMTGLYPLDWVLTSTLPQRTISPTLPEWLPSEYLTMCGGKWQYGLSHVDVNGQRRAPWDREMATGGNTGEAARQIMWPMSGGDPHTQALQGLAMQRIKDFLACARCTDPSKCEQPTVADARPDSPRMAPRAQAGQCTPQPFFIHFSPFIPHYEYRYYVNCPFYPRDQQQCAVEPWKTHSLYCNHPSGFDWSCENYAATVEAILRPPVGVRFPLRKLEYLKHVNTFDRAVDEILVWLKCPRGGNPDCGEGLLDNTVLIHRADHGWELRGSKANWREHAYKTPTVMYDGRGNSLPDSVEGCGGQPGCRNDFVHAVDLRATLVDLSGGTFACDDTCPPCDPTCPNACPCERPDGQSRYSEGRSLTGPVVRPCGTSDPNWEQCFYGREKRSQGIATVQRGWYVLARIKDAQGTMHFCKLYNHCGRRLQVFDLRSDPNERNDLTRSQVGPRFCADQTQQLVNLLRSNIQDKGWYDPCFEALL